MNDVLGYNRTAHAPGSILNGDYGLLDIGGRVGLVQQASIGYRHEIQPIREAGSSDIFFVTGNPMGNLSVTRGVGPDGIWKNFGVSGTCGHIQSATMSTQSGKGCVQVTATGGRLMMSDIYVQEMGFMLQAGMAQLTENMTAIFSSIHA